MIANIRDKIVLSAIDQLRQNTQASKVFVDMLKSEKARMLDNLMDAEDARLVGRLQGATKVVSRLIEVFEESRVNLEKTKKTGGRSHGGA